VPGPPTSILAIALCALALGCTRDRPRPLQPPPGAPSHEVTIHAPERLGGVASDRLDELGHPLRVACVTCHSLRQPEALPASMRELDQFHQGMTFAHGALSCGSCHVVGDQASLHRADGSRIAMTAAIELCRQCHGPQARDYDHGAHGGMTGSWDLSRGGRVRNHCIDCHDPHVPVFQPSHPVLLPRDRGLTRHPSSGDH
jgi:hypothetical protein